MLETIKTELHHLMVDDTTFEDLFLSYVMYVQDRNISREFSYMLRNNVVSVELLDRAISDAYKELIQ